MRDIKITTGYDMLDGVISSPYMNYNHQTSITTNDRNLCVEVMRDILWDTKMESFNFPPYTIFASFSQQDEKQTLFGTMFFFPAKNKCQCIIIYRKTRIYLCHSRADEK